MSTPQRPEPGARVALVDSGGTNIASVAHAIERLGSHASLTADPDEILSADRVILPGVGAAAAGMARLRELGLVEVLREVTAPVLGVCLGMQLLFEHSEEDGGVDLLGFLPGRVRRIPAVPGLRVPHMGWNILDLHRTQAPLLAGLSSGQRAYFVHSYVAELGEATLATTTHGVEFSAVVGDGRVWGAQFHPEKSADVGARLLANFLSPSIQETP
ncbi:imidazole glycerol phosphate synthase subunit HisH [Aestuariimicrobium ganziense]|uniref:imidazole glycerol phosphate synthase subunit HisH n=1 Tax=Aestuariimicrobium ganziense TaxID=2773677 RepID=UPI001943C7E9|nr:imidazole glycerol phosphate synthase subunit HisH [Aestuariimicrobium ganziense]